MTLTRNRACELFAYDPDTGDLVRKAPCRGHRAGGIVGTIRANGYRSVKADGRFYFAHRLIWFMQTGNWPEHDIDHINGSRADNRWQNLRPATRSENNGNSRLRKNNTSGFKGVSIHAETGKWRAALWADGRKRSLGLFETPEAAHAAYLAAARNHFGEFARAA